ncbi:hypothetical protein D9M71_614280 [compost metagenome]
MTRSPAPRNQSANTTRPPCTARTWLPWEALIITPSHLARESSPRVSPKRASNRPLTGHGSFPRAEEKAPPKVSPLLETSGPGSGLGFFGASLLAARASRWRCFSASCAASSAFWRASSASRAWRARVSSMVLRTLVRSAWSCSRACSFWSRAFTSLLSLASTCWRSARTFSSSWRWASRLPCWASNWACCRLMSCSTLASWRRVSLKLRNCSRRAWLR